MATVPTAAQLNLGHNVETTKDTTPTTGPNVELAFAANQIAEGQQKMATDAALKISSDFSAAQEKINLRTDNINRTREFNTYFEGMSKEFQALMDGDVADPEGLNAFSLKLQTTTEEALNNHSGSAESKNKMAMRLENQRAKFSAGANSAVDTAQQAIVDKAFSENIAQTVSKIATGEMDLAQGLIEVDSFGAEYSEVASDTATFNQVEAAQQMVILGSIQRLVDLGQSKDAEAMINSNPEVIQTLDPQAVGKMIRSIELQKIQKSKLIAEKQLNQDNILKGYGVTNPKDLSPELRMLYYTGKMGATAKDNRTKEEKNIAALARTKSQYGKNSPQVKNLERLIFGDGDKAEKTKLEKQYDRLEYLKENEPDSQEIRILQNQINLEDPVFVENKKKQDDFPQAQLAMLDLEKETETMMKAIDNALILATGVEDTGIRETTVTNALNAVAKGQRDYSATGNIGLLYSFISGTGDAAQLEATLTPVTANVVLDTMSKMRAQSSSGATGLGAMNNAEREMLANAAGSLDTRKPVQLIQTLMKMRKSFPEVLKRQQKKFTTGFSSILGGEPELPDVNKVEVPKTPRGQEDGQTPKPGVINLSTYGDGVNAPPTTVTPTTITPKPGSDVKLQAKPDPKPLGAKVQAKSEQMILDDGISSSEYIKKAEKAVKDFKTAVKKGEISSPSAKVSSEFMDFTIIDLKNAAKAKNKVEFLKLWEKFKKEIVEE